MGQYSVYKTPDGLGYLLDVQTDLLEGLNTRVVVPLIPANKAPKPAKHLNPVFEINGVSQVMLTPFLASVPGNILNRPVANLSDQRDEITHALDMVLRGF